MSAELKACPFCKELIRTEAIKCRYCGEWLVAPKQSDAKTIPEPPSVPPVLTPTQGELTGEQSTESGENTSKTIAYLSAGMWVFGVGTMVFALWDAHPPSVQEATEKITSVLIRLFAAAAVFGWIISTTIGKRKGVGLLTFSFICAAGMGLFAYQLREAVQQRKQTRQKDLALSNNTIAAVDKIVGSIKQGANSDFPSALPSVEKTGDATNDEIIAVVNFAMSDVFQTISKLNAKIGAQQKRNIFDHQLLMNSAALEVEKQKRLQCLGAVEESRQRMSGLMERCRERCASLKLTEEDKRGVVRGIENTLGNNQALTKQIFDLLGRKEQTELDFLTFMSENAGQFVLSDDSIKFSAARNSSRYENLTKAVSLVSCQTSSYHNVHPSVIRS